MKNRKEKGWKSRMQIELEEKLKDEKEMDRVVLPQIDAVVRGVVVEGERHGSSAG